MSVTTLNRLSRTAALGRLAAEHADRYQISRARQLREIAYLWAVNGINPFAYYRMGLFRDSIPWTEKKEFASTDWYMSMIERINPRSYRIAAWNKILADGVLRSFNIPSPPFYGFVSQSNGQTVDGRPLCNGDDLGDLIKRMSLRDACFKLVGGWSGRGFTRVSFERDGDKVMVRVDPDGEPVNVNRFWDEHLLDNSADATPRQKAFGYLCQGVVEQHPAVAGLHRSSLNTIRVWMVQRHPGSWEMVGAVLRMGTGQRLVDNGVSGGIAAPIDLLTGRLGAAVRRGRGRGQIAFAEYDEHPTSATRIRGFPVPLWPQVLPLCRRTCAAFPFFRFMGLDVAITPDEVIIIEVEADPHASHQAHLGRGLRSILTELVRSGPRMPPN